MSPYAYCGNSPNVLIDPSGFGGHRVVHHAENDDWTTMEPDEEPMPSGAGYGYEGDGLQSFGGGGGPIAIPPRSKLKQWIKTAKRIAGDIVLGVGHGIAEEGGQMTHYDGGVARICFGWYMAPLRDSGMW